MRWAYLLCGCSISFAATPSFAQTAEDRYALAWVRGAGAEDCPAVGELQREVERRIGRSVFDPAAPLSIEVSVRRDEASATPSRRSEIHVRGVQGEPLGQRALFSSEPDCRSLFSSTALAIALLVDPEATEQRQARPPSRTPASTPLSNPAQALTNSPPAATQFAGNHDAAGSTSAHWREGVVAPQKTNEPPMTPGASATESRTRSAERFAQLTASLVGAFSLVPQHTIGLAIGMRAWESSNVGWSLAALYLPEREGDVLDGRSVRVGLVALQPALILGYPASERLRVTVELGGAIGALHYATRGGSALGPGELPFLAARTELGLQLMLGEKIMIELGGAGLVPLVRARMTDIGPNNVLFMQPALGATGRIGVGIQFP